MRGAALALGAILAAFGALGAACTDGELAHSGLTEPIQVANGQFVFGDLPGTPPTAGGTAPDGGVFPPLTVTTASFSSNAYVISGLGGAGVGGLTTPDAVAVGIRLSDLGTGYWVVPVQGVEPVPNQTAQRDFSFTVGFNPDDTPGFTNLGVVAIASDGTAGEQTSVPLCVESRVPDNGHACSLARPPRPVPSVVFSLTWDSNFDLDLTVLTPTGLDVNPKSQTTTVAFGADGDAGPAPLSAPYGVGLYNGTTGVIDRDSMGSCVVDGWREEDLVFQDDPPLGYYEIYANPFSACGQSSVRFTLTIYVRGADGSLHVPDPPLHGELLSSQATGGASTGLFVAEKQFD